MSWTCANHSTSSVILADENGILGIDGGGSALPILAESWTKTVHLDRVFCVLTESVKTHDIQYVDRRSVDLQLCQQHSQLASCNAVLVSRAWTETCWQVDICHLAILYSVVLPLCRMHGTELQKLPIWATDRATALAAISISSRNSCSHARGEMSETFLHRTYSNYFVQTCSNMFKLYPYNMMYTVWYSMI